MKQWLVYLLICKGNKFYIGITNDLDARLMKHKNGKGSKFVKANLPYELYGTIPCGSKSEALKLEYKLKQEKKENKLRFFNGKA